MSIRNFDWRDLAGLHSIRQDYLFLFNEQQLTGGSFRVLETAFSALVPVPGVITLIDQRGRDGGTLYAQVIQKAGEDFGYLSFLAPQSALLNALSPADFSALIEALTSISGERGALRLLADVTEHSPAFDLLRSLGFSVHTRQRIWAAPLSAASEENMKPWRRANQEDWISIQALYNNLVPALVQKTGADTCTKPRGMVCYQNGELAGYIELHYGGNGICAYPFIHPDALEIAGELSSALTTLPGMPARHARPVYVCVSHYQSWLEPILEEQGALPGDRLILMAKHLTARVKPLPVMPIPVMEKGQAKTIAFSNTGEKGYETHHR